MKVVRYTFDVCLRDGVNKDTYSMRSLIEASIMKCDGVCGCEAAVNDWNRRMEKGTNHA